MMEKEEEERSKKEKIEGWKSECSREPPPLPARNFLMQSAAATELLPSSIPAINIYEYWCERNDEILRRHF